MSPTDSTETPTSSCPADDPQVTHYVLASASPRRRDLLEQLGLTVEVRPADLDETRLGAEPPVDYVRRLSREKADLVAGTLDPDDDGWVVIGADTCVALDDEIFGKPADDQDATRMLRRLSVRPHRVITGVSVVTASAAVVDIESTTVTMTPMTDAEIAWYVATGEPDGKAGGFAIQGIGGAFIESVDGSASNVVGLPLTLTRRLLRSVGVDLFDLGD